MRFRQLNSDPNSVMRKKLVKSKKNWIVVSSLSLAGGLFLLGGPTSVVKAETVTPATQTVQAQASSGTSQSGESSAASDGSTTSTESTKSDTPSTTETTAANKDAASSVKQDTTPVASESTDKETTQTVEQPTEEKTVQATDQTTESTDKNVAATTEQVKDGQAAAATSSDTQDSGTTEVSGQATPASNKTDVVTTSEQATSSTDEKKASTSTSSDGSKETTMVDTTSDKAQEDTDKTTTLVDGEKAVSDVKQSDTTTVADDKVDLTVQPTIDSTMLATNLAASKLQLAKMGIMATNAALDVTPETTLLADGNLAEGTQGTAPWKIDANGVLHIGDATKATQLNEADGHVTGTVSGDGSSSTSDTSSPWTDYQNNINTITFDGTVSTQNDAGRMFANLTNLTTINNIDKLDLSNATSASGLFMNDAKLTDMISSKNITTHTAGNYDLRDMNFGTITDVSDMFLNNQSVKTITFPNTVATRGNTLHAVTNFNYMFKNDISLTSVDMKNWQFSTAKTMLGMFQNDYNLKDLDLTSWSMSYTKPNTGDSTLGTGMFDGTNLQSIRLSSTNNFSTNTALPTSDSHGLTNSDGSLKFASEPGNTSGSVYANDLNSVISKTGQGTTFSSNVAQDKADPITTNMTVQTNLGPITMQVTGNLYGAVHVASPEKAGYTVDIPTIVGTIMPDNVQTNTYLNYTGSTIKDWSVANVDGPNSTKVSVSGSENSDGQDAKVGDTVTISPNTDGTGYYIDKPGTGKIVVDNDTGDITVDVIDQPTYNPVHFDASTVTVPTSDGKASVEIKVPAGDFNDTTQVATVSNDVKGYTLDPSSPTKLPVTYNADGSVTVDTSNVKYNPVHFDASIVTVPTSDGKASAEIKVPAGDFNDTTQVATVSNDVKGYTLDPSSPTKLPVTYNADGSVTVDTSNVKYNPVHFDASIVTVPTSDGKASAEIKVPAGDFNDTTQVATVSNDVKGYTLDPSSPTKLPVTYNADGSVTVDTSNVKYNPVHFDASIVTVPTSDGKASAEIKVPAGDFNDTTQVATVSNDVKGYTLDPSSPTKLPVTYNADGSVTVDTSNVKYNPVHSDGSTVTVPTSDGKASAEIKVPAGNFNDSTQVATVPNDVKGYTLDSSSPTELPVTYDENGKASVDTSKVKYNPVHSNGSTATITTPNGTKTITVPAGDFNNTESFADVPQVTGYTTNLAKLPVTYGADGKASVDTSKVTYTPVHSDASTVTIPTSDNKASTKISIPAGDFSNTTTKVTVPDKVKGYTLDPSSPTELPVTYGADGKASVDTSNVKYNPVHSDGSTVTVATSDGKASAEIKVPAGNFNDTTQVATVPNDVKGYTLDPSSPTELPVTYDENGKASVDTSNVKYNPVHSDGSTATITTPNGTKTITVPAGDFNNTESFADVPQVTGYTTNLAKLPVTYGADGKASVDTSKVTYTPVHSDASTVTIPTSDGKASAEIKVPAGDFNNTTTKITVPDKVKGYTLDPSSPTELPVTYGADGKASVDISNVKYNPVHSDASIVTVPTSDGKASAEIKVPAGDFNNTTTKITVPDKVKGYTLDPNSPTELPVTYGADGKASVDISNVKYNPVHSDASIVTVPTSDGKASAEIKVPAGNFNDTTQVATVPNDVKGYTLDPSSPTELPVTYDENGKASVDISNVKYNPVHSDASIVTVATSDGKASAEIKVPAGNFNDTTQVATVPNDVKGYTLDPSSPTKLPVTYDENGKASVDTSKVKYNPVHSDTSTVTVPTSDGKASAEIKVPAGNFNDATHVATVPNDVKGYTLDPNSPTELPVTYGPDGKAIVDTSKVKYNPVHSDASTATITTPDGKERTIDIPAGDFNDATQVAVVPQIPGYTTNLKELPVTYGPDGKATIDTSKVIYTKIPSSNNIVPDDKNTNSGKETTAPVQNTQNIATYSDKGQINIYELGADNKMNAVRNRGLAHQSTWYSDQKVTVDGIQYYRVATNEWVMASQVYPYEDASFDVRTYDKTSKVLYKSEDEVVTSRMLAPNTSWYSDRVTYVINGEKYYRVATNEFVSAKDAYVYEPTNMVITTHKDVAATALYNAKGAYIGSRSLIADSSWLVDSITYINGVKYYRVATNEFVKASDVDVNH